MLGQEALQLRQVEAVDRAGRGGNRVVDGEHEHHRGVAELEIAIKQAHRTVALLRQGDRQVGGDDRLSSPTLR